jgi:hypothetical protein
VHSSGKSRASDEFTSFPHHEKQAAPSRLRDDGRTMDVSDEQPQNPSSGIEYNRELGQKVTVSSEKQQQKH